MTKRGGGQLSILEACYRTASDDEVWLRDLLESASENMDLGFGLGLTLVHETARNRRKVMLADGVGTVSTRLAVIATRPINEILPEVTFRELYYPRRPILMASPIIAKFPTPLRRAWNAAVRIGGSSELIGMLGYPAPGWVFSMYMGLGKDQKVGLRFRRALQRIRIHVESGVRLRILKPQHAAAVLNCDGKLLHVERSPEAHVMRGEVEPKVKRIENARTERERHSEDAIAVWTALVQGQWSLVEHHDTDGKRLYFAYENAPMAQAYRALTPSEATVLDQSIRGLPGKYIAYACGMETSRISEHLESAALKLGFAKRHDLLRVASGLRDSGDLNLLDAELSAAEQHVLELVREGFTNAEIAERRSTSERTVANQVASLLRKTKLPNRRALAVATRGGSSDNGSSS